MSTQGRTWLACILCLGLLASCASPAPTPAPRPPEPASPSPRVRQTEPAVVAKVHVEELDASLDVFPTVFRPRNKGGCLKEVEAGKGDVVLDIGTGTGLIGLLTARQGASRVVATDINPEAVRNARHNARRLGFEDVFEVRQVSLEHPEAFAVVGNDEKFDLIVSDPPFKNFKPRKMREYALGDENFELLRSILAGARAHLTERGRLLLFQGFVDGIGLTYRLAEELGLEARVVCPAVSRAELEALPRGRFSIVLFEITPRLK